MQAQKDECLNTTDKQQVVDQTKLTNNSNDTNYGINICDKSDSNHKYGLIQLVINSYNHENTLMNTVHRLEQA